MILILVFILFILYTLACIADGPDIKPILNTKIGNYLHHQANKFYHAHYCHIDMCPFVYTYIETGYRNTIPVIEPIGYDMEMVSHTVRIGEEQTHYFKTRPSSVNIIDASKNICASAIFKILESRINYSVDDDNPDCCIYVTGSIICENKRRKLLSYESNICKTS